MPQARVRCPSCGERYPYDPHAPTRPFCSERCQLLDLGDWLGESHRIPGLDMAPDDEDEKPREWRSRD